MTKQVAWTKIILETFIDESGIADRIELGDEKARVLEGIMRTRCAGWTRAKQAEEFHCSIETIDDYIRELKDLYDQTQVNSVVLPKRKKSKKELEMDRNF